MMIEPQRPGSASPTGLALHHSGEEMSMPATKLTAIRAIADLSYEDDPDTDGGYVAEVGSKLLADSQSSHLQSAGYDVSTSRDEDGRWYVWVS